MSQRVIARTGLLAAILTMTLAMGVLAHQAALHRSYHAAEVGKSAPLFALADTAGHPVSLASLRGHVVVLFFGSDACPLSHHYAARLASLAQSYANDPRVTFLAINSNTAAHAPDPADLRLTPTDDRIPTLLDPMANVARSFGAAVTPTVCLIDAAGTLRYAGAFDAGDDAPAARQYLARALERTVDGIPCEITSTQPFGAPITWLR